MCEKLKGFQPSLGMSDSTFMSFSHLKLSMPGKTLEEFGSFYRLMRKDLFNIVK